jgi:hypothetical protein
MPEKWTDVPKPVKPKTKAGTSLTSRLNYHSDMTEYYTNEAGYYLAKIAQAETTEMRAGKAKRTAAVKMLSAVSKSKTHSKAVDLIQRKAPAEFKKRWG